ncbi:MAG: hypothetical protein NC411_04145 [Bacteroides sp.]|nr:hypothetical protein [Bacteroides sp.]
MIRIPCINFLFVVLLIVATACNNDIFIDREPDPAPPSDRHLEIADGGEAAFVFPVKNIQAVEVDFFSQKYDCVKYLSSGEVFASYKSVSFMSLYDASATQPFISRLTVTNADVDFEIFGDPEGVISVKSIRNILGESVDGCFRLRYRDRTETVTFSIASGYADKPVYQVKDLQYSDVLNLSIRDSDPTHSTVSNFGSSPAHYSFLPADHAPMFAIFQWQSDDNIDCGDYEAEIPTYNPATEKAEYMGLRVRLCQAATKLLPMDYVLPDGMSFFTTYELEVPANTGLRTTFTLREAVIRTRAIMTAENTRNGTTKTYEIYIDIVQPISYTFSHEEFKLD